MHELQPLPQLEQQLEYITHSGGWGDFQQFWQQRKRSPPEEHGSDVMTLCDITKLLSWVLHLLVNASINRARERKVHHALPAWNAYVLGAV